MVRSPNGKSTLIAGLMATFSFCVFPPSAEAQDHTVPAASKSLLKVGDKAPDFTLPATSGDALKLGEILSKKAVVLYFYPKDFTPGCTKEACSFRDNIKQFEDLGAEIVGVSRDSLDSHSKFKDKNKLPFVLVCDEKGQLRKAYGVPSLLGGMPARVTFVIDKKGVIRHVFNSLLCTDKHVSEAISTLKKIH